ncbi:MAG: zinc ribbon domain-containing protein [Lentisphaerae bacterium]|nr:zinc ribbon domain-containing protein [Lentisphaerota bacterium]
MPIYEYRCKKCGHTFEHLARTLADGAKTCPKCGARNPVKQISTFNASVAEGPGAGACSTGTCPTGTCPF